MPHPENTTSIIRQRWFGLLLVGVLSFSASTLVTTGFANPSLQHRIEAILTIMRGPLGLHPEQIFTVGSPGWMIWIAITVPLLLMHPLKPTPGTLCATLLGGLFWWFTGILVIAAGC